jgi:hypothetical protein
MFSVLALNGLDGVPIALKLFLFPKDVAIITPSLDQNPKIPLARQRDHLLRVGSLSNAGSRDQLRRMQLKPSRTPAFKICPRRRSTEVWPLAVPQRQVDDEHIRRCGIGALAQITHRAHKASHSKASGSNISSVCPCRWAYMSGRTTTERSSGASPSFRSPRTTRD